MTNHALKSLLLLFLFSANSAFSQMEGLWEVKKVSVGRKSLTPTAKWTRINEDRTFQSGNGWLQNSEGTWTLDKETKLFSLLGKSGIKDEYGAFKLTMDGANMTWERMEEGEKVTVSLEPVRSIPKGPWDKVQGLWRVDQATKAGVDITSTYDPDGKRHIFMRWNRLYLDNLGPDGRLTGYWHINDHRPQLTLMSHDETTAQEVWKLEFSDTQMIWTRSDETNQGIKLVFKRISEFPGG